MRRILRFASPALIALAAVGCHQQPSRSPADAQARVTPPASATDATAWENYMVKVSHADLKEITAKPYLFEVLAPSDPRAQERNPQIQQALTDMAEHNHFPGNAIAVGGPDPKTTADALAGAFGKAAPNSLKGLTVLYIGDQNNKGRAGKAITAAGAAFRFVAM